MARDQEMTTTQAAQRALQPAMTALDAALEMAFEHLEQQYPGIFGHYPTVIKGTITNCDITITTYSATSCLTLYIVFFDQPENNWPERDQISNYEIADQQFPQYIAQEIKKVTGV